MNVEKSFHSANILVVEDDDPVRLMLGELLSREGHRVFLARDGLGAAALLEEVVPDLVITDYHMPEMNGWDLALHIRRAFPDVPIFLITGVPEGLSRVEKPGNPFDGIVAKPFRMDDLLSALQTALERGVKPKRRSFHSELSLDHPL